MFLLLTEICFCKRLLQFRTVLAHFLALLPEDNVLCPLDSDHLFGGATRPRLVAIISKRKTDVRSWIAQLDSCFRSSSWRATLPHTYMHTRTHTETHQRSYTHTYPVWIPDWRIISPSLSANLTIIDCRLQPPSSPPQHTHRHTPSPSSSTSP